ncbi:sterol desaturase family protein [Aquimarina aquimarini]|uniref:sterol desaturase family protein n=1 Tax=Aquimarina aquimarini TaxID=1191734 RepID=UPI000D553B63|nr:sterol desaturase family protein [Aquimarina aquimarini]
MNQNKRLKIGEGKISGYISIFLAIICFGSVICAYFPEYLTTADFRKLYTPKYIKWVLLGLLVLSFGFALTSFILSKKTKLGFMAILIIGGTILIGNGLPEHQDLDYKSFTIGLDWLLLDILISAFIFIPIELFLPKRTDQTKFHPEWRTDLVYFIIGHLLIQVTGVLVQLPAVIAFSGIGLEGFHSWVQSIWFIPQLFLALFVSDLFQWTGHYFFHKLPFLWRFHAVHHSTKDIDWLAGSRTHFLDLIVVRAVSFLPIYVFGFSTSVFTVYIVIVSIQAVLAHSNTRINFGFFKYIFVTPQYHHWHHSADPKAYDKNFAIHFPFIDMLFGTYYPMGNTWPESTGLGEAKFPKGFIRQFIFPFTKNPLQENEIEDPSER